MEVFGSIFFYRGGGVFVYRVVVYRKMRFRFVGFVGEEGCGGGRRISFYCRVREDLRFYVFFERTFSFGGEYRVERVLDGEEFVVVVFGVDRVCAVVWFRFIG